MSRDRPAAAIAAARQAIGERDFERARSIVSEILAAKPDDLDALEVGAFADTEAGNFEDAENALRSAIAIAPRRRWPYADLTRLLLRLDRHSEAEGIARSAVAADGANPDPHAMLGTMFATQERWFEAAVHFEQAIALAGPHPQLLAGAGEALLRLGRLDQARSRLEAAVAGDPAALKPLTCLAEIDERQGRFAHSMELLDRAEPIADAAGTDLDLQRSRLLERMGRLHEAAALLERDIELSGSALLQRGRLRDRMGRYDEAWSDWIGGKSLLARHSGRQYLSEQLASQAERLARFFNSPEAARLPRAPRDDLLAQPIFIIGFPRSGTTLTEQILASHSAIEAGGELPFGREIHDLAVAITGGEGAFPEGLLRLQDSWPIKLRDLYLQRARAYGLLETGASFFTDKMPTNDMWLPLLRLAFPQSPVVHVRRHPLDVLVSVMGHDMTHGFYCSYRLEDAARHFALVDEVVERYSSSGLGRTHELRYEMLVADQARETERLMEAIGLAMEAQQLRFHERSHVSPTPSYAQVREPLTDRSVGRWRKFEEPLRSVRPIVAAALARGGYAA